MLPKSPSLDLQHDLFVFMISYHNITSDQETNFVADATMTSHLLGGSAFADIVKEPACLLYVMGWEDIFSRMLCKF